MSILRLLHSIGAVRGPMPARDAEGNVTVKAQAIREVVDPFDQQEDIDAALSYLHGESMVDPGRIGIWGTSFGGGQVICRAAHDRRVACVVGRLGRCRMTGRGACGPRTGLPNGNSNCQP